MENLQNDRPDFSNYLAHFTSDRDPLCPGDNDKGIRSVTKGKTAKDKLISILQTGKIYASTLPWISRRGVCFTECPWSSLLAHSDRYSPYAVGFNKAFVFGTGGGPAYYVRADRWEKQTWDADLKTFVTPFWPAYRPKKLRGTKLLSGQSIDYSHEREWRVPHDFEFKSEHIEFVIVRDYKDVAQFPQNLKDAIGREKFLMMDAYKQVEKFWPVHKVSL